MNDVSKIFLLIKFFLIQKIGTKSTEKIRDFYYRMLKKVNILLKKAGDTSVNIRNRDEVIAAISCYGKLLKNNSQKNVRKEKEIKKLTNELNSLKKELSQFKQQKNNIEIIAQLNQYNAINTSIGKNTLSKTYNIINSNDLFNSLNYTLNISKERKKLYNEIERLENINKSKKEEEKVEQPQTQPQPEINKNDGRVFIILKKRDDFNTFFITRIIIFRIFSFFSIFT